MTVEKYSDEIKERGYQLWKQSKNVARVSRELGLPLRTVWRWYNSRHWAQRFVSELPSAPKTVVDTCLKMMESIQKLANKLHGEIDTLSVEKGTLQIKALADSYIKLNEVVAKGGSGMKGNGKNGGEDPVPDPEKPSNFKINDWDLPEALVHAEAKEAVKN